jgi:hypothetical protein
LRKPGPREEFSRFYNASFPKSSPKTLTPPMRSPRAPRELELELELIQTQMTQKPMLRENPRVRNDYAEETAYESYMNPEPGFQSGPGDSTNAD